MITRHEPWPQETYTYTQVEQTWQRCPVCEGRGAVLFGFYNGIGLSSGPIHEQCRTCEGRGVIRNGIIQEPPVVFPRPGGEIESCPCDDPNFDMQAAGAPKAGGEPEE